MSGGFFRGTSADQDTRFSNKQAKLLKSQKFAPELDHLVDMSKVNMEVIKPWITRRVTELLGFEDEVLINFINGLLDAKEVNGKEVQIQITGFMEKNTGKFMKELWTLLLSAQQTASGVPQQLLDAKLEDLRKKNMENDRIANEIQRKKDRESGREIEPERVNIMDDGFDSKESGANAEQISKVGDVDEYPQDRNGEDKRNGVKARKRGSRSPYSPEQPSSYRLSPSRSISRSNSHSRSHSGRRSRSISSSPSGSRGRSLSRERNSPRRWSKSPRRRWYSPRRRRSPWRSPSPRRRPSYSQYRSRSRSVHRSPTPIRRRVRPPLYHRSPSPSQRGRSPIPVRRQRSPSLVRRRRSPTPIRRRRSPTPIRRRRSPTPIRRRRSPSPIRRRRSPSPLRRRRSPSSSPSQRHRSPLPMQRSISPSPVRRRSPSPVRCRSPSPARRRSPSPARRRSPSPARCRSPSPARRRSPSPARRRSPSPARRRSPSPARRRSPSPARLRSPVHSKQRSNSPSQYGSPSRRQDRYRKSPTQQRLSSPLKYQSPVPSHRRLSNPPRQRSASMDEWSSQSPVRQTSPSSRRKSSRRQRSPVRSSTDRNKLSSELRQPPGSVESPLTLSSPEVSPGPSRSPRARKGSVSENRRSTSPFVHQERPIGEKLTRERRLSPLKQREQKPDRGNTETSENEETYHSRRYNNQKSNLKSKLLPKDSDYRSPGQIKKDSSSKVLDEENSSVRSDLHPRSESFDPNDKTQARKGILDGRSDKPSTQKSSVDIKISDEKGHRRSNSANDGAKHCKSEALVGSGGKTDNAISTAVKSSGSEESNKHKRGEKNRRKHKRSVRKEAESDDGYSSDSELDDKKEAKRRKKEERKIRKEEKRQRREERRRRRHERRAEKLKTKNKRDRSSDGDEVVKRDSHQSDEEPPYEQKKLEIELRKKALESFKAKKGVGH